MGETDNTLKEVAGLWFRPGCNAKIQGYILTCGNIIVCEKLSFKDIDIEAAYINPNLKISEQPSEDKIFRSYTTMTEYQRYLYIRWLGGNTIPAKYRNSFFRLFLFGCELVMFYSDNVSKEDKDVMLNTVIKMWHEYESDSEIHDCEDYENLKMDVLGFVDCATVYLHEDDDPLKYVTIKELPYLKYCKYKIVDNMVTQKKMRKFKPDQMIELIHLLYNIDYIPAKYLEHFDAYLNESLTSHADEYWIHKNFQYCVSYTLSSVKDYTFLKDYNVQYESFKRSLFYCSGWIYDFCNGDSKLTHPIEYAKARFFWYNDIVRQNNGEENMPAILSLPQKVSIKSNQLLKPLEDWLSKLFSNNDFVYIPCKDLYTHCGIEELEEAVIKQKDEMVIYGLQRLGYEVCPNFRIDGEFLSDYENAIVYKVKTNDMNVKSVCKEMEELYYSSCRFQFPRRFSFNNPKAWHSNLSYTLNRVDGAYNIHILIRVAGIISQQGYYKEEYKGLIRALIIANGYSEYDAEYYSNLYQWLSLNKHSFTAALQNDFAKCKSEYKNLDMIRDTFMTLAPNSNKVPKAKEAIIEKVFKCLN